MLVVGHAYVATIATVLGIVEALHSSWIVGIINATKWTIMMNGSSKPSKRSLYGVVQSVLGYPWPIAVVIIEPITFARQRDCYYVHHLRLHVHHSNLRFPAMSMERPKATKIHLDVPATTALENSLQTEHGHHSVKSSTMSSKAESQRNWPGGVVHGAISWWKCLVLLVCWSEYRCI